MKLEPKIFRSELAGAEYHLYHHPTGLDILIMPMEGFTTTEAIFAARYGSIDNCFRSADTGDFIRVPDGIAHYLEHKLFEGEERGVFERYASTGASANAFTSFDMTGYTFSSASDCTEPLGILLDFVQDPYITDENVEKERGIIAQEIMMSNDSPSRAMFYDLLDSLYFVHPVKIDIAGTVESIQEITAPLLMQCYNTFYDLHNMVLSIAGNVDEEKVLEICDRHLKGGLDKKVESRLPDEPEGVVRHRSEITREVGLPMFSFGFKCPPLTGGERQRVSIICELMLKVLFGNMSDWYRNALETGVINTTFGTEVFSSDRGYFTLIMSGDVKDPEAVYESICERIRTLERSSVDEELFRILKKGAYGSEVMKCNSVSNCCDMMCFSYLQGADFLDTLKTVSQMTADDIYEASKLLDISRSAFCVVNNRERT